MLLLSSIASSTVDIVNLLNLFCPDEVPEWAPAFFVYVGFVVLISICLIKHCSGYSFGLLNRGRKVPPV